MPKKNNQFTGVKEIARRAGVSIGTVDRVLHDRHGVSPKTKEKILAIIRELDYHPNLLARRLASRKVIRFATLIPSVSKDTSFWSLPLQGINQAEEEIRQYNIRIDKYFFDQNDRDSFVGQSRKILRKKPDGVLLAPDLAEETIAFTNKCTRLGIPYVFMDSDVEGQNSLSYIGPHLYDSGYLAANLVNYLLRDKEEILLLNISKKMYKHHHLLRKEEGFRKYFTDHGIPKKIEKTDLKKTDPASIEKQVAGILSRNKAIRLVFVTNSRVYTVADSLKNLKRKLIVMGYDFTPENIEGLKAGTIDFLICQKPGKQAYLGIMALYKNVVLNAPVDKIQFMPIDIITKENYRFYNN
ncbi:MAG: LacI family DNA-binding transcriptional regulator [Chitinophagaceae bacterium]|nr:LacI family DNA-binding transcriptional regulator [Chitinophagaceae bacterium]MCO5241130.1 LacI family DNA-binding transcriptional regulator [Chitinophagaceae bacterium]